MPDIMLATICLNEMEWLPKLYEQHKAWPGLAAWVFVEGCDVAYNNANPGMVTAQGLSTDGTSDFLDDLVKKDSRVTVIRPGFVANDRPDQGKVGLRNEYWHYADSLKPDWVVMLDADEMYTKPHQHLMNVCLKESSGYLGACFRQREIWRPPSIVDQPLLSWEVVGGLWRMHHTHCWKWAYGTKHLLSHVWPQTPTGLLMNRHVARYDVHPNTPEYVHLGWASQTRTRMAKTRYYHARGEGKDDGRKHWMECRDAWERWPETPLPHGGRVLPYNGPVPEILAGGER